MTVHTFGAFKVKIILERARSIDAVVSAVKLDMGSISTIAPKLNGQFPARACFRRPYRALAMHIGLARCLTPKALATLYFILFTCCTIGKTRHCKRNGLLLGGRVRETDFIEAKALATSITTNCDLCQKAYKDNCQGQRKNHDLIQKVAGSAIVGIKSETVIIYIVIRCRPFK